MSPTFKHFDLELHEPDFKSELTSVIIELEKMRVSPLGGHVHPKIFFQLKDIFHLLESLGSARIEGNNTTLSEAVENQIEGRKSKDEKLIEITNMETAMDFIERNVTGKTKIDQSFMSELHKLIVKNLSPRPKGEGSSHPGILRPHDVTIGQSNHKPPIHIKVKDYNDELINFINQEEDKKYNLLITAIAHHRFAWIHPFDNGNGRVVRLLTYAMLIKQDFDIKNGRILNPTAIFCIDRQKYYDMLALADHGDKKSALSWCHYVLNGLLTEINKIDKLLNHEYLIRRILVPTIDYALISENITDLEYEILKLAIIKTDMEIASGDLAKLMPSKLPAERSRVIRRLKDKKMLIPIKQNARKYIINFSNSYLLRGIIRLLKKEGFIPMKDEEI